MTRLTEEMVVARSKQSDLNTIKKLNCWGADLTDVSIVKRMANVEVLALSINKIRTLVDFQHCRKLKELYVRKNSVADLSEIRHLKNLPMLKVLWLEENPCAKHSNYRLTVLRALPHLEKLDNKTVDIEEIEEAARKGTPIADSDAEEDYEPELENYNNQYWETEEAMNEKNGERDDIKEQDDYDPPPVTTGYHRPSALRRSPPTVQNGNRNSQDYDRHPDDHYTTASHSYSNRPSALPRSPPTINGTHTQSSPTRQSQRCYSPDSDDQRSEPQMSRSQYFERSASIGDDIPRTKDEDSQQLVSEVSTLTYRRSIQHSQSAQSIKEYTPSNGDHGHARYQHQSVNRHSMDMGLTPTQHNQECYYERPDRYSSQNLNPDPGQYYQQSGRQQQQQQLEQWERESVISSAKESQIPSAVMADHKGFTRRPMTRNSNLLSAVLCLVKELDYNSLEVAEMAVRCRMDELANRP